MSRGFYTKIALSNIKKNSRVYIPYILTCILTVMFFYIMKSLSMNPGVSEMVGDKTLSALLSMGSGIVAVFSFIFLFYTNSFLMKNRKKEFGLFNILGMEKKHLAKVIAIESLIVSVIAITFGIACGIALDKIMFLLIAKMIGGNIPLGFYISGSVIRYTAVFFCVIFALMLLKSINMLRVSNPVDLLKGGNVGEKEPKSKWFIALLGVLTLGAGYYIALTTKNPITSIYAFFIAAILVIIATYLLFTAGSIVFLKMLRKNKKYYYRTKHFITVSGMIYRMKQNAVGLANICVLSTMVLIMASSTTSIMIGFEDIMHTRYPNEFSVYSYEKETGHNEEIVSKIKELQQENNIRVKSELGYYYIAISAVRGGDGFITNQSEIGNIVNALDDINILVFLSLEDYNSISGKSYVLGNDEILIYSDGDKYAGDTLSVFDCNYRVKQVLQDMPCCNGVVASNIADAHYIVVRDLEEMHHISDFMSSSNEGLGIVKGVIRYYYGFDAKADLEELSSFYNEMDDVISQTGYDVDTEFRSGNRKGMMSVYGGLFFLGIFLGVLFIIATVLIIYYKQISEGYDDRQRFEIMQKVGLSHSEVKQAIRSQVLTVFFLPLIVAGIHMSVAFPMVSKLMAMLNMSNTNLYIACAAASFVVFAAAYIVIYSVTARVYYRIVS